MVIVWFVIALIVIFFQTSHPVDLPMEKKAMEFSKSAQFEDSELYIVWYDEVMEIIKHGEESQEHND